MNLKGTLILVSVLTIAQNVVAQIKNVRLDEQKGSAPNACEPSIAINPRYPNNIVAGSFPANGYFTKDAGKTWTKTSLSASPDAQGNASVIANEKGNFFYFHVAESASGQAGSDGEKQSRLIIQESDDGGATWSPAEALANNDAEVQRRQWATTDSRGDIFLTWTQFDKYSNNEAGCKSNILFSMSKNGKKWTEPVTVSQHAGDCSDDNGTPVGAVPAVSFDGKVFVAWSHGGNIYLDRSFNGGEWWLSNDIVVSEQEGGWNLKVPGHKRSGGMPVLMADNSKTQYRGSLYIVWADQRNGGDDIDIWFSRSHNFGDNWSLPTRVNDSPKGKHQYMPSMAVDATTGFIYVVYYDRSAHEDNSTDVYLAYSNDGGGSFKNQKISETSFVPTEDVFFGDYINISAHKGLIAPVWTRVDDGKTSIWSAIVRQEELAK